MRLSVADVLRELRTERLATDAADAPARAALQPELDADLPWFLRIAVGLGAWFATAFLLGFVAAVAQRDEPIARIIVGAVLIAVGGYARRSTVSEFRKHGAIACSMAGQGLILAGVHELGDSARLTAAVLIAMSLGLLWIVRDALHRFLSTLAAVVAVYILVIGEHPTGAGYEMVTIALAVGASLVWRFKVGNRSPATAEMLQPAGYALIVVLFAAMLAATVTHFHTVSMDPGRGVRLGNALTIAVMLLLAYLAWRINDEHRMSGTRAGFAAITGVLVLGVATLSSPGIIAGAAVLALAFDRRDRVLLGMGVIFLLVFGSVFYYSLHVSLMEKAGVLTGSGLLLLAIRHRLVRA